MIIVQAINTKVLKCVVTLKLRHTFFLPLTLIYFIRNFVISLETDAQSDHEV